jgi:glycosyltransferase involved in cell wall biosynthesis
MKKNFVTDQSCDSFKIIIISTFWNGSKFVKEYIDSIKEQTFKDFHAYLIDDMSTDNTFDTIVECIGNDQRFNVIKNIEKKFKMKNFVDIIRNENLISGEDVIVEIDGDDKLMSNDVLTDIYNIYRNNNVWISNSKLLDNHGKPYRNNQRVRPEICRRDAWRFSHLRTYRAFLFRLIKDDDLKYKNEYFRAGVDLGLSYPMLEMSGSEHYYFLDKFTYYYRWNGNQTWSRKSPVGNRGLQRETALYISKLRKYDKIELIIDDNSINNSNVNVYKKGTNEIITSLKLTESKN